MRRDFARWRRVAVCVPGLLLVMLATPVVLAAQVEPASLFAETRVVGDASAVTDVLVPEGASIDLRHTEDKDITALERIEGEGRLIGFHLVPTQPADTIDGILVLRLPEPVGDLKFFSRGRVAGEACTFQVCDLEAGLYHLYLIADDSPVDMTIGFGGVAGETLFCIPSFCPDPDPEADPFTELTLVDSHIQTPQPTTDVGEHPLFAVRSAGTEETVGDAELVLLLGYGEGEAETFPPPGPEGTHARVEHGICVYNGPTPTQGMQPGCPDSQTPGPSISITTLGAGYGYADSWLESSPSPGTRAYGAWQAVGGTVDSFGMVLLQLGLRQG